jgi:hypothetical protein
MASFRLTLDASQEWLAAVPFGFTVEGPELWEAVERVAVRFAAALSPAAPPPGPR